MANGQGVQDTGNPVLDSFVNIMASEPRMFNSDEKIRAMHKMLLELAEKEPGGLKLRKASGQFDVIEVPPVTGPPGGP